MTEFEEQIEIKFDPSTIDVPHGFEAVALTDNEGRQLFWLPSTPTEEEFEVVNRVISTTPTDYPIMVTDLIPVLENGEQKYYEAQQPIYEQIPIYDEDENIIGYKNGEIVGYEGTGQFLPLYTTELIHDQDENGNYLYWYDDTQIEIRIVEHEPELILQSDERWNKDLLPAYELIPITQEYHPPIVTEQQKIEEYKNRIEELKSRIVVSESDNLMLMVALVEVYEQLLMLQTGLED